MPSSGIRPSRRQDRETTTMRRTATREEEAALNRHNLAVVKALTYVMFAMFAMTTDSVGIIIPEVVRTFGLTLTAAGTFQYATMGGIAVAALLLGHLADRLGR